MVDFLVQTWHFIEKSFICNAKVYFLKATTNLIYCPVPDETQV
jgi:hypothetical protein